MIGISGADADPAEMPGVSAAASVLATKAGSVWYRVVRGYYLIGGGFFFFFFLSLLTVML